MKYLQKLLALLLFTTILFPWHNLKANNNLIILIDQNNQENPNGNSRIDRMNEGALTMSLGRALAEEAAPILATGTLLYNHVARIFRYETSGDFPSGEEIRKHFNFFHHKWQLYAFPSTNYVLMLPRCLLSASDQQRHQAPGLDLSHLDDWTKFLPTRLLSDDELPRNKAGKSKSTLYKLVQALRNKRDAHGPEGANFAAINKQALFVNQANTTTPLEKWSIYLSGHGRRETTAAGLTLDEARHFLAFLNDEVSTNFVCIESCFIGGTNKYAFEPEHYNFALMLAGRGNYTSYSDGTSINFREFFAQNSAITQEGVPVVADDFTEAAAVMADHSAAEGICAHPALANIHQIKSPGERSFSLISPKNRHLVHKLSPTKPNIIRGASMVQLEGRATLVYEAVSIAPSTATALGDKPGNLHRAKESLWARLPVIYDLMEKFALIDNGDKIDAFLGLRNRQTTYPTLTTIFDNLQQNINSPEILDTVVLQLCSEEYLYPSFSSDKHSPLQRRQRAIGMPPGTKARRGSLRIDIGNDDDAFDDLAMNSSSSASSLDSVIVTSSSSESLDALSAVAEISGRAKPVRPATLPYESHFFGKIFIEAAPSPEQPPHPFLGGVLNFIRDSSCDILRKSGRSLVLIEELVGSNDISPIFEASRYLGLTKDNKKTRIERALEDLASQHVIQQPLALEQVYLYTSNSTSDPDSFEIKLAFVLAGRAWNMHFVGDPRSDAAIGNPIAWQFDQINREEHIRMFNQSKRDVGTHLPSPTK